MIINIIDRVKHSFRRDKSFSSALHNILGFYPHNIELYRIALAHKSQAYRNQKGKSLNNERLEFLGDAILEAVVSDIIYHRYERKREGFMTSTRSKIVQRSSLNRLAVEMGLDKLIRTTVRPNTAHNNIDGNAFEALVGAIYLDRGYSHCKWFVEKRIMGRLLDIDGVAQKEVNFKSKLLEWAQKNKIQADYRFDETQNEGTNNPVFHCRIVIEGVEAGRGKGYSKKESQQTAAKEALAKLRKEPQFLDSIFRAKEKRTAMEAQEICALPKIDEIEESIAQEKQCSESRHAKRAPKRKVAEETIEATAKKTERNGKTKPTPKAPEEEPPIKEEETVRKPRSRRSKAKKENTAEAAPQTEKAANEKASRPSSRQRRSNRAKNAEAAESAKEREAIIQKAEEAAFGEG